MQLVTVYTSLYVGEADLMVSLLNAAEFHPVIDRGVDATGGYVWASGGIRVQVPEDEAADAREFLAAPENPPA